MIQNESEPISTENSEFYIGIDVGGTFTDGVLIDQGGSVFLFKTPTVSRNPTLGFISCLTKAAESLGIPLKEFLSQTKKLSYGTTIATNALLEGKLAKTGLIITRGFKDVLSIARIGREYLGIDLQVERPPSLVSRGLTLEVTERIDSRGQVMVPMNREEVERTLEYFHKERVEAIAISLLWSFKNQSHEKYIDERAAEKCPGTYISLSSEVAPVIGEYERTATTVMNASLGPLMEKHLSGLSWELEQRGFPYPLLLMQSIGGVVPAPDAALKPVTLINSGPAGGVIAGKYLGEFLGISNCICIDMGGTSFDVSLITQGQCSASLISRVKDNNIVLPMLDIYSIGAGGGSIAWLDRGKRLKVGPQSAGAIPGPVCYGKGGAEPTVTDADVVLGRINPNYFLGGEMVLDVDKARDCIEEKIALPLGMDLVHAAWGLCRIVDANMAGAVRTLTIQKGYDPRDYSMIAFGGAGPTHCSAIARELGIKNIIISPFATAQSAYGIVHSDIVHSLVSGDIVEVDNLVRIARHFQELEGKGYELLKKEGLQEDKIEIRRYVDMRYKGQAHEVTIPVSIVPSSSAHIMELKRNFETRYELLYGRGTVFSQAGYEIVNFRLEAIGKTKKPVTKANSFSNSAPSPAFKGEREVFFQEGFKKTSIFWGEKLKAGNLMPGPAIIEYMGTTVVVEPWQIAQVDAYHNLILSAKV